MSESPTPPPTRLLDRGDTLSLLQHIVHLTQCPRCSLTLENPVTLPCGRTLCRKCLPPLHPRAYITYPANPNRLQGFLCPFEDCGKEHAADDCALDVIANNAVASIRGVLESAPEASIPPQPPAAEDKGEPVEPPEPNDEGAQNHPPEMTQAGLGTETDLNASQQARNKPPGALQATGPPSSSDGASAAAPSDPAYEVRMPDEGNAVQVLERVSEAARPELDCQVCYALFCDAVTTQCGHTFCRHCLHRILDHSDLCAVCRRQIDRGTWASNKLLTEIETALWAPALEARQQVVSAENGHSTPEFGIPIFVCTLSFPKMPTFLHVFEPRYRLMISRALEQDRTFGMVLHRRARRAGEPDFVDIGTLLRIINVEFFPDGRSLIETMGVSRFRILQHGMKDGYVVARIERVHDVSIAEEEALEAAEIREALTNRPRRTSDQEAEGKPAPLISGMVDGPNGTSKPVAEPPLDLDAMSTEDLLRLGVDFVRRMRHASAVWLTHRILAIYGECPEDDAAKFPWWFASVLPVNDLEKYRLLGTASVRERLKICCHWIQEWESSRWSLPECLLF